MSGFEPLEEETLYYDFYPHTHPTNDTSIVLPNIKSLVRSKENVKNYPNELNMILTERKEYDFSRIDIKRLKESGGYNVTELKTIIKEMGLTPKGNKKDLVAIIKIELEKRTSS